MTAHLRNGLLMVLPDGVGKRLADALVHDEGVVYSPGYWRVVMFVIRRLPDVIFKKMKI